MTDPYALWQPRRDVPGRLRAGTGRSALATLIEVAVYLPALVGAPELHETIGLPPMLLPVLWAVLGGA